MLTSLASWKLAALPAGNPAPYPSISILGGTGAVLCSSDVLPASSKSWCRSGERAHAMGSLDFSSASSTAAEMGDLWGSFLDRKNPGSNQPSCGDLVGAAWCGKIGGTSDNCQLPKLWEGIRWDEYGWVCFICIHMSPEPVRYCKMFTRIVYVRLSKLLRSSHSCDFCSLSRVSHLCFFFHMGSGCSPVPGRSSSVARPSTRKGREAAACGSACDGRKVGQCYEKKRKTDMLILTSSNY